MTDRILRSKKLLTVLSWIILTGVANGLNTDAFAGEQKPGDQGPSIKIETSLDQDLLTIKGVLYGKLEEAFSGSYVLKIRKEGKSGSTVSEQCGQVVNASGEQEKHILSISKLNVQESDRFFCEFYLKKRNRIIKRTDCELILSGGDIICTGEE